MIVMICIGVEQKDGEKSFILSDNHGEKLIYSEEQILKAYQANKQFWVVNIQISKSDRKSDCFYKVDYIPEVSVEEQCKGFYDKNICYIGYKIYRDIVLTGKEHEFCTGSDLEQIKKKSKLMGLRIRQVNENCIEVILKDRHLFYTDKDRFEFIAKSWTDISIANTINTIKVNQKSIGANGVDMSKIKTYFGALSDITGEVDVSTLDFSSAIWLTNTFEDSQIKEMDFTKCNFNNAWYMGRMFSGTSIDKLNFSNSTTMNVITMQDMFYDANIKNLNIQGLNTENVI